VNSGGVRTIDKKLNNGTATCSVNTLQNQMRSSLTSQGSFAKPEYLLILQGDRDEVVPSDQSALLYERLAAARVLATLVMVKNAGHGWVSSGGSIDPPQESRSLS